MRWQDVVCTDRLHRFGVAQQLLFETVARASFAGGSK